MLSFMTMSRLKKSGNAGPIFILVAISIMLTAHRIWNASSSIGMLNTDTEGTAWWIWSRCTNQSNLNRALGVAIPNGFDFSSLPTFNLVDEVRILIARVFGCNSVAIILEMSLFPTLCLIGNSISGYFLGFTIFGNRKSAFVLGIVTAYSSQTLLSTRTPLANNVLFLGILATCFAIRWLLDGKRSDFVIFAIFQVLQTLANVYNGFSTLILVLIIFWALPFGYQSRGLRRLKGLGTLGLASLVGLIPLAASQAYLYTNHVKQNVYRPIQASSEILPFSSLLRKDRGLYDLLAPSTSMRPEAGWLTTPLIVAAVIVISHYLFKNGLTNKKINLVLGKFSISILLLISLIWRVPFFDSLRDLYFSLLYPLRGVSNFAKVVPILIAICILFVAQPLLVPENNQKIRFLSPSIFIGIFCLLFLCDNIPIARSYWQTQDVRPLINTYKQPNINLGSGPIAHFPDYLYGPKWGLPQRFIQLAQIGDGHPRLNGRDYTQLQDGSAALPLPIDEASLNTLLNRGAETLIFHSRLISQMDLQRSLDFLKIKGYSFHTWRSSLVEDDIYQTLDLIIVLIDN